MVDEGFHEPLLLTFFSPWMPLKKAERQQHA
jgi:hypothetical protein